MGDGVSSFGKFFDGEGRVAKKSDGVSNLNVRDLCDVNHHKIHADAANKRRFFSFNEGVSSFGEVAVDAVVVADGKNGDKSILFYFMDPSVADGVSLLAAVEASNGTVKGKGGL